MFFRKFLRRALLKRRYYSPCVQPNIALEVLKTLSNRELLSSTNFRKVPYKGTIEGMLTQTDNKDFKYIPKKYYMRRIDLMNPTETLDTMSVQ
jgi:hypothetical protein